MKLTSLTPEQVDMLPVIRDEWLNVGLSTEPSDRSRAQAGAIEAYRAAGLEAPRIFIWLDSPMAGAVGAELLPTVLKTVGDQVWAQVRDQVGAQVWAQVRAQVWDQVSAQVWDQVGAQVWDQVRAQVWDQVGDQVRDQVRAQVRAQVREQVSDQVSAQVWAQVWAQVSAQVWDQVRAQVWDQVGEQVWDQVSDQVGEQVRDQVGPAVYGQHDANWLAFYDTMARFGIQDAERLHGLSEVARSCGWWWPFQGAVIFTDRPSALLRDQQGRLHNDTGPALVYRDGWAVHAWHGVGVPEDFWTWDTQRALTESNTEIRRCAIERLGWDTVVDRLVLVAEAPDPGNSPHTARLYDLPTELADLYPERARILVVHNASLDKGGHRRVFGIPVPAHHKDPVAAAADLFGVPVSTYRQLAHSS